MYSRANILELKFVTQKCSAKKSCLFNQNLSLSFRKKTVYNELLVLHKVTITRSTVWNMYRISSNKSRGAIIIFLAQKGSDYSGEVIILNIAHWTSFP